MQWTLNLNSKSLKKNHLTYNSKSLKDKPIV